MKYLFARAMDVEVVFYKNKRTVKDPPPPHSDSKYLSINWDSEDLYSPPSVLVSAQ